MKKNYKIPKMPNVALGTWQITNPKEINEVVTAALNNGYKHIDTAQVYSNEEFIGQTLSELDHDRESYWITTKIWCQNFKYHVVKSLEESLKRLQTSYVDAVLLHASMGDELNVKAYKELMAARDKGLVREIGVSNFKISELEHIKQETGEYPRYNQVIASVKRRMNKLENFCQKNGITLMAYSTIRPYYNPNEFYNSKPMTENERGYIDELAKKYKVSSAVILLRWALQHGYVILPKSSKKERVIDNFKVNEVMLLDNEMNKLSSFVDFKDKEYEATMDKWRTRNVYSEEEFKKGVRIN